MSESIERVSVRCAIKGRHLSDLHHQCASKIQVHDLLIFSFSRADPVLRAQEVRVGFRTQDLPVMTRMLDRRSTWGRKLGLRTLIPTALTLGVIGYPFVQADMIGGNDKSLKDIPELFIRWLQVCNGGVMVV